VCRLHQSLVNDLELALYQYGGFDWGFDPVAVLLYVAVAPGKTHATAEAAFDSVLAELTRTGPSAAELEKAKNSLTANFYKNYKTNNGTAQELARYKTLYDDYRVMYDYVPGVSAVTAEQVKEVMARYFKAKNSTTVVLVPEGGQS